MKKTQLKNIIRESIKELMTEQGSGCTTSTPGYYTPGQNPANGTANQAVNWNGTQTGNMTWFICADQAIAAGVNAGFPAGSCCQAQGWPVVGMMNANTQGAQSVQNAQNSSAGSNSGVDGLYARYDDCVQNCAGMFSATNPPPNNIPCGDDCYSWSIQNSGPSNPTNSSSTNTTGTTDPGSSPSPVKPPTLNDPCEEYRTFSKQEQLNFCEDTCSMNPSDPMCECCPDDTILRMQELANIK